MEKLSVNNIVENKQNIFVSPYADKSALRTEILWQKDENEPTFVELWNLIFTQFDSKNIFEHNSPLVGADSGASLERIVTAYENGTNNYENTMWRGFVEDIKADKNININSARKIAELSNTSFKLVDEGLVPGNKVQPYMLRKILRSLYDLCDNYEIDIDEILTI